VPNQQVDAAILGDGELNVGYVEQRRARISRERPEGPAATALAAGFEIAIAVAGLVDVEAEKARLGKELETIGKELAGVEGRLSNESFTSRAPAEIVEKTQKQAEDLRARRELVQERLRLFAG
jgi:valyl-tRNA synthetase